MSDTAARPHADRHHDGHPHDKDFRIIVNGQEKTAESNTLSYDQVVRLAYPSPPSANTIYTVSFEKAKEPHEGSLVAGQCVGIREGTEFDVTPTGKS